MPAAALEASAPGMPRSTTVTETPRWARRNATADPMMPPPMIATSVVSAAAVVDGIRMPSVGGPVKAASPPAPLTSTPDFSRRRSRSSSRGTTRPAPSPSSRPEDEHRVVQRVREKRGGREDRHFTRRRRRVAGRRIDDVVVPLAVEHEGAFVVACVDALPEDYGRVVRLYDLQGLPIADVSRQLGRSSGAVHMLRARAHDQLRVLLGPETGWFGSSA